MHLINDNSEMINNDCDKNTPKKTKLSTCVKRWFTCLIMKPFTFSRGGWVTWEINKFKIFYKNSRRFLSVQNTCLNPKSLKWATLYTYPHALNFWLIFYNHELVFFPFRRHSDTIREVVKRYSNTYKGSRKNTTVCL